MLQSVLQYSCATKTSKESEKRKVKSEKDLRDILREMDLRKSFLKKQKKNKQMEFDPEERIGELIIWIEEIKEIMEKAEK